MQELAELLRPVAPPRPDNHVMTEGGLYVQGDYIRAETQEGDKYVPGVCAFDGCRLDQFSLQGKTHTATAKDPKKPIDISWLPFCAEQYQISPNIADYVLVEVPIVVADVPNRNMDAFPYTELTAWRTANSRPAYATFIGKPVHLNHDNLDDTKAKGVIFDASLVPFRGKYHVKILKGFDRSKDPQLAKQVQERDALGHSMGALVEQTECSIPNCRFISDGTQTCKHINGGAGKGGIYNVDGANHVAYELMRDYYFIESSYVGLEPAYVLALSDTIWG